MLNLKSELLKKEKELAKKKFQGSSAKLQKPADSKASKVLPWMKKNNGVEKRNNRDLSEVCKEDKESKVKAILEAKAKLYNKMTSGSIIADDEDAQVFLVDFEQKSIDAWRERKEKDSSTEAPQLMAKVTSEVKQVINEAVDQWVEYVDGLGRTRTCLKEELPKMKQLDQNLGANKTEGKTLMSDDMRREEERMKWEKEALEDQDELHYENLRFGEVRELGVGYFAFSGKQEERDEQMRRLDQLRKETEKQKKANEAKKQKQQVMLNARLEKVRQRRIKKLKSEGKEIPAGLLEPVKAEPAKAAEEPEVAPEVQSPDDVKAQASSSKVRDWDKEKVDWTPARVPELPHSWTDPREERPSEFAPPTFYYSSGNKPLKQDLQSSGELRQHSKDASNAGKRPHSNDIPQNAKIRKESTSQDSSQVVKDAVLTDQDRIQRLIQNVSSNVPLKQTAEDQQPITKPYIPQEKPFSLKVNSKPKKFPLNKSALDL